MKMTPRILEYGSVKMPTSSDGLLQARAALDALGAGRAEWDWFSEKHKLSSPPRDFGAGPEPTLSLAEFTRLAFSLQTPQAGRWRARAQKLLTAALAGDVQVAAQIAERNPEPQARRWLAARLESSEARRELMSTVARHGGQGRVYGQLGSLSNRSVLGKSSAELRRERGVRQTRDGLSSQELLRMAYLDTATAHAIGQSGASGNAEILAIHQQTLEQEQGLWQGEAQ